MKHSNVFNERNMVFPYQSDAAHPASVAGPVPVRLQRPARLPAPLQAEGLHWGTAAGVRA